MCGISGIYAKNEVENIVTRIENMNVSLQHRGPDAGNCIIKHNALALGHRRLSIIDTSDQANQPMRSNSERWHIVFNGEIYNFKEIKSLLTYNFKTNCDTEVILAAVEEHGLKWFLNKAIGMFAIALFDNIKNELIIIRDRLGIKPLYYYYSNDLIVFASEIKAILHSGLVKAEFNESAVDEYLANRYVRSPFTFFKNIYQLEPGSFQIFDSNLKTETFKFWELPTEFNMAENFDEQEILNSFETELVKAINYRLVTDVPLGTYLSGGVDSSIITAITSILKKDYIHTYTIGFEELNEFEFAKLMLPKYKLHHHEILITQADYLNNWENLIYMKDAPLGVPNEIPLAIMSTKLKEKITVVLSGEGADELLGGYGIIYRAPFDYRNENISKSFYEYFISKYEYVHRTMRDEFLNTPHEYRLYFDQQIQNEFLNKSNEENVFKFFHQYHIKGLLQRVDMASMQASVEARVPFLDHNLIEFAYKKIPYQLKLKWCNQQAQLDASKLKAEHYSEQLDIPKYLLKRLAYKYIPKDIIERRKVGFPVPLSAWIQNLEDIASQVLQQSTWLKQGVLKNLLDKIKTENRAGQIVWMFVNIELFNQKYFLKEWRY
ncbi:MAG: asparagine synthase (glutamine-hydrolyzing) [Alphaproteobacteria bacterium]|nr:asparagine synthase (glutamine-hydrolyzing) [Alphaproteobacteria bacterium]